MKSKLTLFKKWKILFFFFTMLCCYEVDASHFRGGTISWDCLSGNQVEYNITTSWRLGSFSGVSIGSSVNTYETFYFGDGSFSTLIGTVTFINASEDWFTMQTTFTHTFSSAGSYDGYMSSCCRISGLPNGWSGDNFTLRTTVNAGAGCNEAPSLASPAFINVAPGNNQTCFQLNAVDPESDPITFSIANTSESGLTPDPSTSWPGGTLSASGLICVNPTTMPGAPSGGYLNGTLIPLPLKVSDNNGNGTIPGDIMLKVSTVTGVPPTWDYTVTPADGSTINFFAGVAGSINVEAEDADAGNTIDINPSGVPGAAIFTPALPNTSSPNATTLSWTPTIADAGSYPITLIAQDNTGLQTSTSFNIVVQTCSAPVASCKDVTVGLDDMGLLTLDPSAVDDGTTYDCGLGSLTVSPNSFDCTDVGSTVVVTLTVTDTNGDSDACTANVTIEDIIPPTPLCDLSVSTTLSGVTGEVDVFAYQMDDASVDNCTAYGDLIFSYSGTDMNDNLRTYDCDDVGSNNVSIWVWDEAGNVSEECFAILQINDDTGPTCMTQDITVSLSHMGMASITVADIDDGTTDWCGVDTMYLDIMDFDCDDVGVNIVTLTAVDVNGNSSSCSANVTVEDNGHLHIHCQDINVYLDASGNQTINPQDLDDVTQPAEDNCGVASFAASQTSFNCSDIGVNTVVMTVTDVNGNTASCSSTVTVIDTVPPTAVCQDVTIELDASGVATVIASDLDGGSTDACGIDPTGYSVDIATFNCSSDGVAETVVLTVSDIYGNTSTCSANVTVEDNIAPVAVCNDITVQLDVAGEWTVNSPDVDGGSSDNCGSILYFPPNSILYDCDSVGVRTFALYVDDSNGQFDTCYASVTVMDTIAPEALCQDITVQLDSSGEASIGGIDVNNGSNDACGIDTMYVDITDFTCADVDNPVTVTLTVVDNNGNMSTCSSTVTVEDNVNPIALCQDITIQLDSDGLASIGSIDIDNGSNDACGIDTMYVDIPDFTCSEVGPNNVTLTVVDNNGNMATCTSTAIVEDNVNPDCQAMDITIVLDALGDYTVAAMDIDDGSSDACGIASYEIRREFNGFFSGTFFGPWSSDVDFGCDDVAGVNVQLRVTDNNGNQSICDAVVSVEDETSPFMNCQDNIVVSLNSDGEGALVGINLLAWWGIFDACGIDNITVDGQPIALYDCSDIGFFDVLVRSEDVNGNATECTVEIEVRDQEDPDCVPMDITIYLDANGVASIDSNAVDGGSSDNCTITSITLDNQDFDCSMVDDNTVTMTVEDQSGNTSTCDATVTVLDTIKPVCATMDITVQLDVDGIASIDSNAVDNASFDACGIASVTLDDQDFTCADVGSPVTVTQTVTDVNGNVSTCTAVVTVEDNVPPMVNCIDITVQLDAMGEVAVTGEMVAGTVSISTADLNGSNTGTGGLGQTYFSAPITSSITMDIDWAYNTTDVDGPAYDLFGYYLNGSFIQISDNGGANSQSGTFTITLNPGDVFGPQINATDNALGAASGTFFGIDFSGDLDPSNWTLTNINANGSGTINPGVPSSTDACGIASYDIDMGSFDCSNIGDNDVTVTVTDVNGNSASCMSIVTVEDNVAPVAICQDITVALDENGEVSITGSDIDGGSNDICGIASLTASPSMLTCSDLGPTSVTLTVMDVNGNSSTCSATVTVEDNIAPTMICQDITVVLDSDGNGTISASDVDNGSSDNCSIVEWTVGPEDVGCEPTDYSDFTYLGEYGGHTYYKSNNQFNFYDAVTDATEHGGILASISDATENALAATLGGSSWIGFNDIRVEADFVWYSGEAISYTNWLGGEPNNAGNEDGTIINFVGSGLWNDVPINLTYTYILEVATTGPDEVSVVLHGEDQSGNTASCISIATLSDVTSPDPICQNITVQLDNDGVASIDSNAVDNGSMDACGIASFATDITSFNCSDVGDVDVVLTVTDVNGNSATCSATVTVEDNVNPVALCQDITVELDFNGDVTITGDMIDGGSMDACGIASLDAGSGTTDLDCSNVGANTVTLTVTDVNGNMSTCDATVTVEDNTAPLVNCVNNVEVPLNTDGIGFVTKEEVTGAAFDACGIVDTFIIRNDFASHPDYGIENEMLFFDCDDIGLVPVIIRVYDANGNMEECNTAVNVKDEIEPTMVCTSTTIYLDGSGVAALDSNALDNGSYDNCAIVEFSVSQTDFDCSHLGMNLVTMTAEDQSGNSSSCSNGVMVMDTIMPTAICMDILVSLDPMGNAMISGAMIDGGSTDNCSIVSMTASPNSFTCSEVGPNMVTLTVEDQSGNTSTCTAMVTVEDKVSPMVECVASTINLELSDVNGTNATVTPGQLISQSVVIKGSNASAGGSATTNYSVVVTAPTVLDFFWFYSSNNSSPQYDNFGYTINGVYTQLSDDSGALIQSGSATVALNPTDVFGVQVIATDDIFGRATGSITGFDLTGDFDPANWTLSNSSGADGSAYTNSSGLGATDACGIASITIDKASFDCSEIGDHTVTVTATDVNGNSSTCQSIVTVQDVDAPIAVCMDIIVQLDALGVASIDSNSVDGGSFDGCTVASITTDITEFTCADLGDNTVIMTVTDQSGNSSTCTATVTVEDNVDPVALCQDIVVQLDEFGLATITAEMLDGGSSDACGSLSFSADITSFACNDVGPVSVVLTVTDGSGNESTCNSTVTVEDNVDPTAVCAAYTVQLDDSGTASIAASDVDGGSSDACGIASMSVSPSSFTCAEVGANTVTLTITDNSGNTSTCDAIVTVEDNVAPDAICMNISIDLDANGVASIDSNAVDGGSSDACGIASFSTDLTSFDCSHIGDNNVVMTVTDGNGNTSACTATVTVSDVTGPVLTCPSDIIVNTLPTDCNQNVIMPSLAPMDVCTGLSTYEFSAVDISFIDTGVDTFALFPVGDTEVTVTATDGYGNTSECTFNITVVDNIDPIIVGCDVIGDITVDSDVTQCGANVSWDDDLISANDNCSGQGAGVIVTSNYNPGDLFPVGTTTVIYTATDDAGNTGTCSFDVTVNSSMPTADFTALPTSLSVIFTNESINGATNVWVFDDGYISTEENPTHVYAAAGTYNVCLTVENGCGDADTYCEDVTVADTGECLDVVTLNAGWNLISFDVEPADNTLATIFADEISANNLMLITAFNGVDGATVFDPLLPPFLNSLQTIEPGYGYWVQVINPSSISLVGTCLDINLKVDLTTGWNLISYIPQPPTPPQVFFSDLITNGWLELVTGYDQGSQIYDPSFPIPALNTLTDLENGLGYWVKVNTDVSSTDWIKGNNDSSSTRNEDNTDEWGNLRTNSYDFLSGKVFGVDDGQRIKVVNEFGELIVELEVFENGYLKMTPIYGDDSDTPDVIDGLIFDETLYFEYKGMRSEVSIDFKGTQNIHFVDLEFEEVTTNVTSIDGGLSATIAPNPMLNSTKLTLEVSQTSNYTIQLIDMTGKQVRSIHNGLITAGKFETTIDRNGLIGGQYLITVIGDKKDSYSRIPLLIIN